MARSHGVIKTTVWEPGSEFRARTLAAQWCYAMLVSQPQINNCGVVGYAPEKWARFASDLTQESLAAALAELEQQRFIVIDEDAAEVLVRTFIKHDRIWKQPNLVTAARREYAFIESDRIRGILAAAHPWLLDNRATSDVRDFEAARPTKPLPEGLPEPLTKGVPEGVSQKGVPEGLSRARDAGAHGRPLPLPQPQTTSPQEMSSSGDQPQPATPPALAAAGSGTGSAENDHPDADAWNDPALPLADRVEHYVENRAAAHWPWQTIEPHLRTMTADADDRDELLDHAADVYQRATGAAA